MTEAAVARNNHCSYNDKRTVTNAIMFRNIIIRFIMNIIMNIIIRFMINIIMNIIMR